MGLHGGGVRFPNEVLGPPRLVPPSPTACLGTARYVTRYARNVTCYVTRTRFSGLLPGNFKH